jgi:hypothetical protein
MGFRGWLMIFLALIVAILGVDVIKSSAQLSSIQVETTVNPPNIVADGTSKAIITIRVTQNGIPRAGDMMQMFLTTGAGRILPAWARTDENGVVTTEFTPNTYSPYDPVEGAVLQISDTSIGQLVEVRKDHSITIPLGKP